MAQDKKNDKTAPLGSRVSKTGIITSITEGKTKLLEVFSQRQTFTSNAVFSRWNKQGNPVPSEVISKSVQEEIPEATGGQDSERGIPPWKGLFQLGKKIGEGGYSEVYEAYDNVLKRTVAVKTLIPGVGSNKPSKRRSFVTEARATAFLDHPNIIPVHGIFMDEEHNLYLSMKLVNGVTLKTRLQEIAAHYKQMKHSRICVAERIDLWERLTYFLKVCDAIAYAHHKQVIHRDLKPENIMIGRFNEVYVMDWGLAEHRNMNANYLPGNGTAGTLKYVAPEIVMGQTYDSRSDIFSLGSILFETVFLTPLFFAETERELSEKVVSGQCEPMHHAFGCPVDKDLKNIIRKAVEIAPGARYQTVQTLIRDLQKYVYSANRPLRLFK